MNAVYTLGIASYDSMRYEDALKHFDQVLKDHPQFAPAYNFKGLALDALKQYEEAVKAYDEAIRLNPHDTSVHNNRGVALVNLQQYEQALSAFDEALRLDPRNACVLGNKGSVLRKLGRYEEALQSVEEALRIDAHNADDQFTRGLVLCELKQDEEALRAFDTVIKLSPKKVSSHLLRGFVLHRLGRYEKAIDAFNKALLLHPEHAHAHYYTGLAWRDLGRYTDAVREYDQALRIQPCAGDAHYERGNALQKIGQYEEAVKAYDEAIRLNPKHVHAHHNKGLALGELQKYEKALQSVDESIRLDANNVPAYGSRGSILAALGQYEQALCAFDEALRLSPNNPDIAGRRKEVLQMKIRMSGFLGSMEEVFPAPKVGALALREETQDYLSGGTYIVGGNRSERVSLLTEIVKKQAEKNEPLLVFDTNGDLTDEVIKRLPDHHIGQTYLLDLTDRDYPVSLNIFSSIYAKEKRKLFFKFLTQWLARLWSEVDEYLYVRKLLNHVIATLAENQKISVIDLPAFLLDASFRERVAKGLHDWKVQEFWMYEYGSSENKKSMEDLFLQRIRDLLYDNFLEQCLGQRGRCLDLPAAMRDREILLVKLPVEEDQFTDTAKMIGGLLLTLVPCMVSSSGRSVTVVVDEFQHFCTEDFGHLFTQQETNVKLIFAQQRGDTIDNERGLPKRSAILSAHTVVSFRAMPNDASELTKKVFPGVRRRGTNIESKVLEGLHRHRHSVVKEFYIHHVRNLQEAAKMRIEVERWQEKVNVPSDPNKPKGRYYPWEEVMIRHSRQILPEFDFGHGSVQFTPSDISALLDKLNKFLYYAQKTGTVYEEEKRELLLSWLRMIGATWKEKEEVINDNFIQKVKNLGILLDSMKKTIEDYKNEYRKVFEKRRNAIETITDKNRQELDKKIESEKKIYEDICKKMSDIKNKIPDGIFKDDYTRFDNIGLMGYLARRVKYTDSLDFIEREKQRVVNAAAFWQRKRVGEIWDLWIEARELFWLSLNKWEYIRKLEDTKSELKFKGYNLFYNPDKRDEREVERLEAERARLQKEYIQIIEELETEERVSIDWMHIKFAVFMGRMHADPVDLAQRTSYKESSYSYSDQYQAMEHDIWVKKNWLIGMELAYDKTKADLEAASWVEIEKYDETFESVFDKFIAALIADPIASDSEDSIEKHLMELPENHAYVKIGTTTSYLKLNTWGKNISDKEFEERRQDIITRSRKKYAKPLQKVEEEITASFQ